MKIQGTSEKVEQFKAKYFDRWCDESTSRGVIIRIIDFDSQLRVMLEIKEDTTNQDIRDVAPLALAWRNRLFDFQRTLPFWGKDSFLEFLSDQFDIGKTYAEIAESINVEVSENLREYLAYRKEIEKLQPKLKKMFERDIYFSPISLNTKHNPFALMHAGDVLSDIGIKDDEIDMQIKSGLERIANKQPPFDKEFPVNRDKIIGILRVWRKGKKHKEMEEKQKRFVDSLNATKSCKEKK